MTKNFATTIAQRKNKSYKATLPFEFDENASEASVAIPHKIHLIPVGQWEHDLYGPIIINASDIREYQQNFNAGVRKGIFITAGHEGMSELPAVGWIQEVESREDGLWGIVDWNKLGVETLSDKQFKFFSPEMYRDYKDPETHQFYRNVLTGGALTKSPYFKELEAVVFSEPKNIKNNFQEEKSMKTLAEILDIEDVSTLTTEEKAVLKEGEATLTEEQKVKFAPALVVEAPVVVTPEEKIEVTVAPEEKKEEVIVPAPEVVAEVIPEVVVAPVVAPEVTVEIPKIEASEKNGMVTMTKQMYSILEKKANEGAEAFAELEKNKLDTAVSGLLFSETNKAGTFLPKSKDTLRAFMQTLNVTQKVSFTSLLKELPKTQIFEETGDGKAVVTTEETPAEEVEKKIEEKIAASEKAGKKMSYSEALKQVMSENVGLETKFDKSLKPLKGQTE